MIKYYNVDTEDLKKKIGWGGGYSTYELIYTLIFRKSPEFTLILQWHPNSTRKLHLSTVWDKKENIKIICAVLSNQERVNKEWSNHELWRKLREFRDKRERSGEIFVMNCVTSANWGTTRSLFIHEVCTSAVSVVWLTWIILWFSISTQAPELGNEKTQKRVWFLKHIICVCKCHCWNWHIYLEYNSV